MLALLNAKFPSDQSLLHHLHFKYSGCIWCLSYSYVMQRHHLRTYILLYSDQVKIHNQISPSFRPVYRTMWRWSLLSLVTTWNLPLLDEMLLITTLWGDPYYCILSVKIIQLYSNSTNIRMTFLRRKEQNILCFSGLVLVKGDWPGYPQDKFPHAFKPNILMISLLVEIWGTSCSFLIWESHFTSLSSLSKLSSFTNILHIV